jgi:hypothetical protein
MEKGEVNEEINIRKRGGRVLRLPKHARENPMEPDLSMPRPLKGASGGQGLHTPLIVSLADA